MVSNYRNIYGNIVISTRLCDGGGDDNDDDDDNNGRGGDDDVFFWVYKQTNKQTSSCLRQRW